MDDKEFEDIENQSYKDIVKVAKSLNVKANGTKESILKRISDKIKQQKNNDNNKSSLIQTLTPSVITVSTTEATATTPIINNSNNDIKEKSILNDKQEILFWKVFKSIVLRNKIFSMNKSNEEIKRLDVFNYYEVSNVEWMVMNGHENLLREKVLKGDRLIFNSDQINEINRSKIRIEYNERDGIKRYYKYSIFSMFKKNEDTEFYRKLFKNYPLYFSNISKTKSMLKDLTSIAIEYDNLALFQVLVDDYEIDIGSDSFEHSLDIGSFEVAYFIYIEILESNLKQSVINSIWKNSLDYTRSNEHFITTPNLDLINKKVDFLLNKINIQKPISKTNIVKNRNGILFDFLIFDQKLQFIIECCYTISNLKSYLGSYINSFKTTKNLEKEKLEYEFDIEPILNQLFSEDYSILSIEQLNEIKSNFIEKERENKIKQFSSSDKRILKLFNMLIIFTTPEKIIENFLFYKAKYFQKYPINEKQLVSFGLFPAQFGDFKIDSYYNSISFMYCPYDNEKKLKFIDDALNALSQSSLNFYKNLVLICIQMNHLEGVKKIIKQFKNNQESQFYEQSFDIPWLNKEVIISFKSLEMFDMIFINSPITQNYHLPEILYLVITYHPEYLNYFKNTYESLYSRGIRSIANHFNQLNELLSMETFNYLYENWSDFNFTEISYRKFMWLLKPKELILTPTILNWFSEIGISVKKPTGYLFYQCERRALKTCDLHANYKYIYHLLKFKPIDYQKLFEPIDKLKTIYFLNKDTTTTTQQEYQFNESLIDDTIQNDGIDSIDLLNSFLEIILKYSDLNTLSILLSKINSPGDQIIGSIFNDLIKSKYFNIKLLPPFIEKFKTYLSHPNSILKMFKFSFGCGNLEMIDFLFNNRKDLKQFYSNPDGFDNKDLNNFICFNYLKNK